MPGIPAKCDNCGHEFIFNLGGGATVTVSGNMVTCPKCHGNARLRDGTYGRGGRVDPIGVGIESGPPLIATSTNRQQRRRQQHQARKRKP